MSLVVFGLGYSGQAFARHVRARFARILGTVRSGAKARALAAEGFDARVFPGAPTDGLAAAIASAEALLATIPPGPAGDPVLASFAEVIAAAPRLRWIGYLSTIGVYGDRGGAWVSETEPARPASARSRERLKAEDAWRALGETSGRPVHCFRTASIYGPGRSAFDRLADGSARRLVKPGQVFNRIHVDDIATVLAASVERPRAGAIYNLADDEPAPPQDVVAEAARLAGVAPPPEEPFVVSTLSPMARSFYEENKRASNRLIREELGVVLRYPTYREGLRGILAAQAG